MSWLPSLCSPHQVTPEQLAESDRLGVERAAQVKAAMEHVWSAYRSNAWGFDEIGPKSGKSKDSWGGMTTRRGGGP